MPNNKPKDEAIKIECNATFTDPKASKAQIQGIMYSKKAIEQILKTGDGITFKLGKWTTAPVDNNKLKECYLAIGYKMDDKGDIIELDRDEHLFAAPCPPHCYAGK